MSRRGHPLLFVYHLLLTQQDGAHTILLTSKPLQVSAGSPEGQFRTSGAVEVLLGNVFPKPLRSLRSE